MANENRINQNVRPQNRRPSPDKVNNSGRGKGTPVLRVVSDKFNWGAFLLNWIWGLGNNTYIALLSLALSFIPFVGIVASLAFGLWLGFKGNTLAWQNKRWKGVKHFHEVQKKWAIAGVCLAILSIVVLIFSVLAFMSLPTMMFGATSSLHPSDNAKSTMAYDIGGYSMRSDVNEQIQRVSKIKYRSQLSQAFTLQEALDNGKCGLSPSAIAKCFADKVNTTSIQENIVYLYDESKWSFYSDGFCKDNGACGVNVFYDKQYNIDIPIIVKSNGYLEVGSEY